ncbi:MAG: hypothetical protein DI603_10290 [Roseateles depolymerans]|uniref:DUF2917 domain-containing protein n=1 Tax=Roseateles depolymerans TaxID=76731 RepID=A0A2W5FN68_9BURK|nr:MAG: hypothetical protein DI603_10290 [Roseateles depolymerans]PZR25642.1 MAG: hypothetical protein DI538_27170 [Azospira oryzae]
MRDADSVWCIGDGQALTLTPLDAPRRLTVARGRVWLTLSGTLGQPAQDQWLAAGEATALPAGQAAVLEGWPAAEFELLHPPGGRCSAPRRGLLGGRPPRGG